MMNDKKLRIVVYSRQGRKTRVAAYARTGTCTDSMSTGLELQKAHYMRLVETNPTWELTEIYTDEGIHGTGGQNRPGFMRMFHDALNGKFDLIITKSVARFSRNLMDALVVIRQLSAKGVEVFFEKEGVGTLGRDAEPFLAVLEALSEAEKRCDEQ